MRGYFEVGWISRAEESTGSCEDCYEDVVAAVDVAHELGEVEEVVLIEGTQFLGLVDGDYGDAAADFQLDLVYGLWCCIHVGEE